MCNNLMKYWAYHLITPNIKYNQSARNTYSFFTNDYNLYNPTQVQGQTYNYNVYSSQGTVFC